MNRYISAIAVILLAASLGLAQTTPPSTPAPSTNLPGWAVQLTGGYSLVAGANTNNGFFSSVAVPVWHSKNNALGVQGRGDYFSVSKPTSYFVGGGPELRGQFSKDTLLNGQVFEPFATVEFGLSKLADTTDSAGATISHPTKFAFKIGGGLDTILKGNVTWRLVEVDYIHSSIYPNNGLVVSNFAQVSTGIGIRF